MASLNEKNDNMNALAVPAPALLNDTERVLESLENPQYDWRTVDGVARETNIPPHEVEQILKSLSREVIRSAVSSEDGRPLYTTVAHYKAHAGILRKVLSALSDQVR
jgi:N-glycosylase/DNA lyase